jgi:hypothetical protein
MTREAAQYIESIANGVVPAKNSEEAIAYTAWSEQTAQVSGTWVEFQLMRIKSMIRMGV